VRALSPANVDSTYGKLDGDRENQGKWYIYIYNLLHSHNIFYVCGVDYIYRLFMNYWWIFMDSLYLCYVIFRIVQWLVVSLSRYPHRPWKVIDLFGGKSPGWTRGKDIYIYIPYIYIYIPYIYIYSIYIYIFHIKFCLWSVRRFTWKPHFASSIPLCFGGRRKNEIPLECPTDHSWRSLNPVLVRHGNSPDQNRWILASGHFSGMESTYFFWRVLYIISYFHGPFSAAESAEGMLRSSP